MTVSRYAIAGLLGFVIAGCSNAVKDEQDRLEMVTRSGSFEDVCQQSKKVVDAALAAKDERYGQFVNEARSNCSNAKIEAAELDRKAEALADNLIAEADRASAGGSGLE